MVEEDEVEVFPSFSECVAISIIMSQTNSNRDA